MPSSPQDPSSEPDSSEDETVREGLPPILVETGRIFGTVAIVGLLLFALTGVWPPMVAVQSGSMEPQMERTDLIVVMDTDRSNSPAAQGSTGVVTAWKGEQTGHTEMGSPGDIIIFQADGDPSEPQVIHRAMFWVEEGDNWVNSSKVNPAYLPAPTCDMVRNCPAPHSGFITKGDANPTYDQAMGISEPVKPEWIHAEAEFRIPHLGWFRLAIAGK